MMSFTSPRNLNNEECLVQLGKTCQTVLNILWNDKENSSLRELNSIMQASQLLFVFRHETVTGMKGTQQRLVKVFLSSYFDDHEIWQDVKVWRLCLQRLINVKFHDAVKA